VLQFLTGIFHACSPAQQHAISADGYLHVFEKMDDLYRFIGLLNAAQLHGFSQRSLDLSHFHLGHADLGGADLGGADLRGANLGGAFLAEANLGGADLRDADLRDADLGDAGLGRADLHTVENPA
jgi:uncharacterized protein YjbI with pentapeptide repeats